MISRRALLSTGAAVAVVAAGLGIANGTHRLDDLARAAGIQPRPEPDSGDERLIVKVAEAQAVLLATLEATASAHPALKLDTFLTIGRAHLEAVGRTTSTPDVAAPPAVQAEAVHALTQAYAAAARDRAADAERAVSPDLARVLASMSAGLAQCSAAIGDAS